jgi:hypothetical protein
MERMLIDERSEYTARAADGENAVLVGWDATSNRMVYSINGGPFQTVARQMRSTYINPTRIAMTLLYEHVAQCQATDNEELTLP